MIANYRPVEKDKEHEEMKMDTIYIPIENIRPNPYQPRKHFNNIQLEELSKSIKEYGVLQAVTVRKISPTTYEIVTGERRLKAAILAGLKELPCIIVEMDDNNAAVVALVENLQRENLTYMEEAEGYRNLINEHKLTQENLAKKVGKTQSTIANKLRLLRLSPNVKKIITDNKLSERHARAILRIVDEEVQIKVLEKIISEGMNVKKTEELVDKIVNKYAGERNNKESEYKQRINDIRIFVNSIKRAVQTMKESGINVKAAQFDRGEYVEFLIRIPKKIK